MNSRIQDQDIDLLRSAGGKRTITPQETKDLLGSKGAVIIDVRRKADLETAPGMIPSAVWRDPQKVEQWSEDLPRDREIIIYCVRGGSVSNSVLDHLLAKGIKARYVEGGIEGCKAIKGQVER